MLKSYSWLSMHIGAYAHTSYETATTQSAFIQKEIKL